MDVYATFGFANNDRVTIPSPKRRSPRRRLPMSAESFRSKRSFAGPGSFLVSMVLLSFSYPAPPGVRPTDSRRARSLGRLLSAMAFPMLKVGATGIPFGSSEAPTPGETPAILGPSGALLPTARNRPGASGIPLRSRLPNISSRSPIPILASLASGRASISKRYGSLPFVTSVSGDQQNAGPVLDITITGKLHRLTASRLPPSTTP